VAHHTAALRASNLDRVFSAAIEHGGTFTRGELIDATGLSAPTIGSLVADLIREGLLTDLGSAPSRGGRRPSSMELNASAVVAGAIDLGPTRTRLALADVRGERVAHRVIPTPRMAAPDALLDRLADELMSLFRQARIPREHLIAVAAGAPGPVDHGVVVYAPNLDEWSHVPMAELLRDRLGVPVVVENDTNLAVMGEHWRGAARAHDNCVFLYFGTGIGAGILLNGHLYRGHRSLAGEIGWMCMSPTCFTDGQDRMPGLESLVGLRAVAAEWRPGSDWSGSEWVVELFAAADRGDDRARKIVDKAAGLVGTAIANLAIVLDPSLIVLGGALLMEGRPLVDEVRRIVARAVPSPPQIVLSALDKEAPLFGGLLAAVGAAREQLRARFREMSAGRED
jgi:glucokinase